MKKKIRCYFTDFWFGFDYKKHLGEILSEYELVIDKDTPDYLFFSCFGWEHLKYDYCIKIFYCGENCVPDFNLCDYAMSLSDVQFGDRTSRYCFDLILNGKKKYQSTLNQEELLNRKFCNFVYSNNGCADPFRERIFKELSKYKQVDSGGKFLNNIGRIVENKRDFQREYKFSLAIENSSVCGYTTEKIYDPFLAQSLPIYWGNPNISSDFRPNSFVNLMDYSSIDEAVGEIIRLDNDDAAYLEKVSTPFWPYGNSFNEFYDCELERERIFFRNIFEQPLEKAGRRARYGWGLIFVNKLKIITHPSITYCLKASIKRVLGR